MPDLKKNMRKAAAYYKQTKTRRQRISGLGSKMIDTDDTNFFSTFGPTIAEYVAATQERGEAADPDFMDIITGYNNYTRHQNKIVNDKGGDEDVLGSAAEQSVLLDGEDVQGDSQKGVTPQQETGIREIGMWMYRHGTKDLIPFISAIQRKTNREKLFMFYLIEKNKRRAYTNKDFYISQSDGYVPNLDAFRKQMVTTKAKFWKWMSGEGIRWDKVEDAAQASRDMQVLYEAYKVDPAPEQVPHANQSQALGQPIRQDEVPQELQGDNDENHDDEPLRLDESLDHAQDAMEEAAQKAEALREALIRHRGILAKREGQFRSQRTQAQAAELSASINAVKQAMKEFKAAKDRVGENVHLFGEEDLIVRMPADEETRSSMTRSSPRGDKTVGEVNTKVARYGGWTKSAYSQYSTLKKIQEWKFPADWETGLSGAGSGLSLLSGLTSLIAVVTSVIGLCRGGWKANNAMSNVVAVTDLFNKLISGAGDTSSAASQIITITQGATAAGAATAKAVAGWGMVISGGIDIGMGFTKAVRSLNSMGDQEDARQAYRGRLRRADQAAQNQADQEDQRLLNQAPRRSKDDVREQLLFNMMGRQSDNAAGEGIVDMVSGGLKVAGGILMLAGVTAPLGLILGTAGLLIGIGKTIAMWIKRKKDRKKTVDEYLHLDNVVSKVKTSLGGGWKDTLRPYGIRGEGDLKDQLRLELMAKMDCGTIDGAYMYIVKDYAKMIYRKAFFKENGEKITRQDIRDGTGEAATAKNEFIPIMKALKLSPVYPVDQRGEPSPGLAAIMAKLAA